MPTDLQTMIHALYERRPVRVECESGELEACDDARSALDRAVQTDCVMPQLYRNLGDSLGRQGRAEEAQAAYRRAAAASAAAIRQSARVGGRRRAAISHRSAAHNGNSNGGHKLENGPLTAA